MFWFQVWTNVFRAASLWLDHKTHVNFRPGQRHCSSSTASWRELVMHLTYVPEWVKRGITQVSIFPLYRLCHVQFIFRRTDEESQGKDGIPMLHKSQQSFFRVWWCCCTFFFFLACATWCSLLLQLSGMIVYSTGPQCCPQVVNKCTSTISLCSNTGTDTHDEEMCEAESLWTSTKNISPLILNVLRVNQDEVQGAAASHPTECPHCLGLSTAVKVLEPRKHTGADSDTSAWRVKGWTLIGQWKGKTTCVVVWFRKHMWGMTHCFLGFEKAIEPWCVQRVLCGICFSGSGKTEDRQRRGRSVSLSVSPWWWY